jgi:hypothetical protein
VCGRNDTVAVSGDMVPRRESGTGRLEGAAPGLRMQSIASTHIWQIRSGLGACLMRKQGSRGRDCVGIPASTGMVAQATMIEHCPPL